jgi:chemotaxis protein methyltransferase CheR
MAEYPLSENEFLLFKDLIYGLAGIHLTTAKLAMVRSRLQKRLRLNGLPSFAEYYKMVCDRPPGDTELTELVNCMTTNKTDFFREQHHFDFVTNVVIPDLAQRAGIGRQPKRIRVWHAGCSTGEEPYSLGITLAESLGARGIWDVRQLASDIDTKVLAHAEQGVYDTERLAPVPERILRKYFLKGRGENSDLYKVHESLRGRITFRQINLLDNRWPINPNARFDMIFCRNVIIYFDKPTQRALFARFEELMRPGGYLFIGHSESLHGVSGTFESLGKTIYRFPEHHNSIAKAA